MLGVSARRTGGGKKLTWRCLCACGKECLRTTGRLRHPFWHSCGCAKGREVSPERKSFILARGGKKYTGLGTRPVKTNTCTIWTRMRIRCSAGSPKRQREHYYDRGIRVCRRWYESYAEFLADMGERPGKDYSLDRVDVNGHYSCGKCDECMSNGWPANCRWATRLQQSLNKRNSVIVEYNGERKHIKEWSVITGIRYNTLYTRIVKFKWPAAKAFTQPIRAQGLRNRVELRKRQPDS